jgi:hypothetical protein
MVSNIQAFVYEESLGNTYKRKKSSFDFVFSLSFGGQKWTKSIAQMTKGTNTRLPEELKFPWHVV